VGMPNGVVPNGVVPNGVVPNGVGSLLRLASSATWNHYQSQKTPDPFTSPAMFAVSRR
jgi:hypothetical protein